MAQLYSAITPPDTEIRALARERHLELTKPAGALGRLEDIGAWLAACQGVCPPRPLDQVRVVVFAGDHGVADKGVSAYPSAVTRQMVGNIQSGGAAVNVLAQVAGATVRVVDIAVDTDAPPSPHKTRRSSGSIDREDALSEAELDTALNTGRGLADAEVDNGADLLIAGDLGIGNTTPAATIIGLLTDTEPVAVVGRGTGIDDNGWMRKVTAIRDATYRARSIAHDPLAVLRRVGGADLAAMTSFLAQAAVRRTPVVLDGVVVSAAALLAEKIAPGAADWWIAGHCSSEPAHRLALEHLHSTPLVDLGMRLGEGSGALVAVPILHAAVAILRNMATFTQAEVSTADADPRPVPAGDKV